MALPTSTSLTPLQDLVAAGVADRIRTGSGASGTVVVNTVTNVTVTFSPAFPVGVTPVVVIGGRTSTPNSRFVSHDQTTVTNAGFTAQVINTATTSAVPFTYIAFG